VLVEDLVAGELRANTNARELLYPLIDAEIEKCIAGEPEGEDACVLSAFVRAWSKQT